jgi:hypothetical protein
MKEDKVKFSEKETKRRFETALRGAFGAPPPHKDRPKKRPSPASKAVKAD